ncbi:MAG: GLPGLI family protein [Saprospiraceae bacterium]|nr:GLPGLI family protein [Saprospiraceae bacterium]
MKIKLILFIITTIIENGFTQNTMGKVSYNFQTNLSNSSPINKPAFLLFDAQKSVFIHSQGPKGTTMKYNDATATTIAIADKIDLNKKDRLLVSRFYWSCILQELSKPNTYHAQFFQKTPYLSQEPKLPHFNWKIENTDSLIGKFKCQKATTRFRGRNYEAWFTKEVPISNGPWKFHGLPGLILEVRDDKHEVKFEFQALEMPFDTTTTIEAPTDGKKVDFDTYKKASMIEFEALKKKLTSIMDGRGTNIQVKLDAYNPIEKSMSIKSTSIILILFTLKLAAQNPLTIKGIVRDSINHPIPFANIYVQESENTSIVAFAASNIEGGFELRLEKPTKRFLIKAAFIGYETKTITVENSDSPLPFFNFTLLPKNFVLKETIIKASGKIIEKSDTTTFLADRFRDSTERNLEELLAKLPGIDVDKNTGAITVKGQPIKKILIEGDDLTGRNYQLMSKNLAADVVDKIQVIDKFNENKLLRGIRRSEDKVINITLKENRKNLLFGNANFGLGNDWRTNNSVNLFSFSKKIKSLTFGNFNKIGNQSEADRMTSNDFGDETVFEQLHALVNDNNTALINIGRTPSLNIGSQSVRFNQAGLLSSHFIIRPIERLQLKGSVSFANDNLQVFTDNDYQYKLPNSTFNLSESNKWTHDPKYGRRILDAGFDVSENATMRYKMDLQLAKIKDISTTSSNSNFLNNQLNNKSLAFQNTLEFTRRISEKRLFYSTLFIRNNKQINHIN